MDFNFNIIKKQNPKLYQIFLTASFDERLRWYTGLRVNYKDWRAGRQRASGDHNNSINASLDRIEKIAKEIRDQLNSSGKLNKKNVECLLNFESIFKADNYIDEIKNSIPKIGVEQKSFFGYWDEYYEISKTRISKTTKRTLSKGTLERIIVAKNHLKKFEEIYKYELTPYTITEVFYEKFSKYIMGKDEMDLGNSINSFSDQIKWIKHFCKWLNKRVKDMPIDYQDFERHEFYDEDKIEPLYPEEVIRLWSLDLSIMPQVKMSYHILMTMISYGFRISDYNLFNTSTDIRRISRIVFGQEITGEVVSFKNQKTRTAFNVPLVDDEIFKPKFSLDLLIKEYGHKPSKTGTDLNRDIPAIFKAARITRINQDTSKICRKTFATVKLIQGYEIPEVMKMGGWKKETEFRKYVGLDRSDLLIKATRKAEEHKPIMKVS